MEIKKILEKNNFVFKKKYGQNFLLDQNILDNIVSLCDISKDTLIIEIGVGSANLTRKLSSFANKVLAYEIDKTLEEPLKEILAKYNNIDIIFDDFLSRNIKEDIKKYKYDNLIVAANLPYYITTPIITKFIDEKIDVKKMVLMVQNEVADRFSAKVKTKDYNSLTIFLNYHFNIKKAFLVSKNVFYPKPNVDSAIVVFDKKENKLFLKNESLFLKIIKDAFKQKRKTIKNNLKCYNLDKIEGILKKYNKSLNSRAEEITIEEFAEIANNLD